MGRLSIQAWPSPSLHPSVFHAPHRLKSVTLRYAEILEVRHAGSLRFQWDVDPETTAVPLPKLLLQPLLENAVKHGVLCRDSGGVVILHTRFVDAALQLIAEDNGPGIPPGTKEGLGLRMVRERISVAHPGASLRLESSSEGTRATIEISGARGSN